MKPRLILIFVILISSCTTETTGWRTLDFGAFKIKSPQGWTKFKEQGIDSYVGGLTNGRDSLWFDYGWYSAEIDDEDASNHLYAQDTINGLVATIQVPKIEGHGIIMLSITHVNEKDRFSFYGHDIAQTDTVLKMFKSIVFKESDTTKNPGLTKAKFKDFAFGSGRMLYLSNCASCHDPRSFNQAYEI